MQTNRYAKYYTETVGKCDKCNPPGFIAGGNSFAPCRCFIEYTKLKSMHDTGLPRSYWDGSMETFVGDPQALSVMKDYIKNLQSNLNNGIGLYLYGDPGVGKTLLASYAVTACLQLKKNVKFYYFTDVLTKFTDAWKDERARGELEQAILNSDLLVLDDIGREYKSNKNLHESVLDTVLRNRANQLKPIIVTSNYDIFDIKEHYGRGIVDLFKESLVSVKVSGDSYRRQKLDDKLKGTDSGPI